MNDCIVCGVEPAQEGVQYCASCGELAFASGPDPNEVWNEGTAEVAGLRREELR